jgi:hypothetical protein
MSKIKLSISRLFVGALILYGIVFLASYLVSLGSTFYVGKDNGLEFQIISLGVCASLYFFILYKKPKFLLMGCLVGFFSYLFLFFLLMFVNNILKVRWGAHWIGNHLIAATMIFIIGIVFFKKKNSTPDAET